MFLQRRESEKLVVFGTNFEVRLGVCANRTSFRSFVAGMNVTTVATFPDSDFVAFEDDIVGDVLGKL